MKIYRLALLTFVLTFVITTALGGFYVKRKIYIHSIQKQFSQITQKLNENGLDIAYDHLTFSYLPFSKIMTAENFIIYNMFDYGKFNWEMGKLSIKDSCTNFNKISLFPAPQQSITFNHHKFDLGLKDIRIVEQHNDKNIQSLALKVNGLTLNNLFEAEKLIIDLSLPENEKMTSKQSIELLNVKIDDQVETPLLRKIDRIMVKFDTYGMIDTQDHSDDILAKWQKKGGYANIEKFIVRWEPLVLVGKGNFTFDSDKQSNIKLNTTSKGLVETLEMLNEGKAIDNSGFYVVKILLDGKAYKLKEDDQYKTVTTSLMIKGNKVLLENVPIYEYISQK
ncbi:MAG: DUF2125 domain-containing protein [Alphaproteobacteria bacterium]|nr:DUF2125 domain-containing protein [Alphaproteobacteria bacterium]